MRGLGSRVWNCLGGGGGSHQNYFSSVCFLRSLSVSSPISSTSLVRNSQKKLCLFWSDNSYTCNFIFSNYHHFVRHYPLSLSSPSTYFSPSLPSTHRKSPFCIFRADLPLFTSLILFFLKQFFCSNLQNLRGLFCFVFLCPPCWRCLSVTFSSSASSTDQETERERERVRASGRERPRPFHVAHVSSGQSPLLCIIFRFYSSFYFRLTWSFLTCPAFVRARPALHWHVNLLSKRAHLSTLAASSICLCPFVSIQANYNRFARVLFSVGSRRKWWWTSAERTKEAIRMSLLWPIFPVLSFFTIMKTGEDDNLMWMVKISLMIFTQ